jgi:hypothetical protein
MSCGNPKKFINSTNNEEEAVVIKNDSLEYEITIFDVGFNSYLNTIAKPANFYSIEYYEARNRFYVSEWNRRAMNPIQFGDFYANQIAYESQTDYGLDVNYKLFNYFKFVEYKYRIRLR